MLVDRPTPAPTSSKGTHVNNTLKTPPESHRSGKIRPMILLWALGIPLPIVLIIALMRGCF
jgi:hypothetical protein